MIEYSHMGKAEHTKFHDANFPFHIFEITNSTTLSHWHKHMEIIEVIKGVMTIGINGNEFSCSPGDLIVTAPGSLHTIKCADGQYNAMVIGDTLLSEIMLDRDMNHILKSFIGKTNYEYLLFPAEAPQSSILAPILREIKEGYKVKAKGYRMGIKLNVCQLLLAIDRMDLISNHEQATNTSINYIREALTYIEKHYSDKITLVDMSQLTNLSQQHFARLFKGYTGKTLVQYLTNYRLDVSMWYLKNTDLPITQIPEKVGFCNANYYARVFKSHYGLSPRDFRMEG